MMLSKCLRCSPNSQKLIESLIESLSSPQKYQDDMDPPDTVACLATISFSEEENIQISKVIIVQSLSQEYTGTIPLPK